MKMFFGLRIRMLFLTMAMTIVSSSPGKAEPIYVEGTSDELGILDPTTG